MPPMRFIPWRQIALWRCTSCGNCCKDYSVVLKFPEWLRISHTFGSETTVMGLDKLFIKRADDGRCTFLCRHGGAYLCGLQNIKPQACRIWPFKVLPEPRYGEPKQAAFEFAGKQLYIYADGHCSGLRYGEPTREFSSSILREFAEIAMGTCGQQHNSTRRANAF
jgi:Fe-S-cluster containining protein